ncbi:MAG: cysteine--tRNA ligase, partial [Fibrobacteres bacterium]|nr:cysteine--tRNA ligase [Fibrobacterota bacterium]
GYDVKHIMNITDVGHLQSDADVGDDKMETGSIREGKSVWEIAAMYTDAVMADFKALNILPATIYCKATEHIPEQIELIKRLEAKGFVYTISDGVYFDTSKFPRYADFARIKIDELEAGARVEMTEGKKNVTDFALWKFSPKDHKRQMEWESPWGVGFPGWHIECSAMAMKYLGETFDIHCGGIDHIPIHHTNEIAQTEAATGKKFVNYWLHGEFLVLEKEKMAKSGGNSVILKTLQDRGIPPLAYRFFLLSAHYKAPLTFSWEIIENSLSGYKSLVSKIQELRNNPTAGSGNDSSAFENEFQKHINDDLNMPRAIAVLWDMLKSPELSNAAKLATAEKFDLVLGLGIKDIGSSFVTVDGEAEQLVKDRDAARAAKEWKKSDELRDKLVALGYKVLDTKQGTKIEKL